MRCGYTNYCFWKRSVAMRKKKIVFSCKSSIFDENNEFFMKNYDFEEIFEEKWTILQSSTYRQRGKRGFCMKMINFEWKMNDVYYYFHDNLYTVKTMISDFNITILFVWILNENERFCDISLAIYIDTAIKTLILHWKIWFFNIIFRS